MRIAIVAGGASARAFEYRPGITVIAVNGAIDWIEHADYFFTLDMSPANAQRCANQRPHTIYCAALPEPDPAPAGVLKYIRVAKRGVEPRVKDTPRWWLWRYSAVLGLNTRPGYINTGNSAYGALGLAYHAKPEKVALFGVDGDKNQRVEGGYSKNLSHLSLLFSSAAKQINVVNAGKLKSDIPSMNPHKTIKWLLE